MSPARVVKRSAGVWQRTVRPAIAPRPPGDLAPASFGQEQIWLHGLLAPMVPLYTESVTIRYRGWLHRELLLTSFLEFVRRHEAWRTTFEWNDGRLMQRVHSDLEPRITVHDVRDVAADRRDATALELAAADLAEPFDVTRESGVRARLVTLADDDHRLFLCLHHLVFDGISIYRVLLPELAVLYDSAVAGVPPSLEAPPLQYADFAYWQRVSNPSTGIDLASSTAYWRTRLTGAPTTIDLAGDRARPAQQSFRGALALFDHGPALTAALRRTAREQQCTVFMVLLAGFAAMLHGRSGQTDMVIGSVSGGRDRRELERVVGYFLRTLMLRIDLRDDPTFREILKRVRETVIEALSHDAVPFQHVVHELIRDRDLGRSPLFQVTFSVEPPMPAIGPAWDVSEMDAGAAASKFDLSIELDDREEAIRGRAIYAVDLFDAPTIADLLGEWRVALERGMADPERRLCDLVSHGSGSVR